MGWEKCNCVGRSLATCFGDVDLVAAIVLGGVTNVPSIYAMRIPGAAVGWFGVDNDTGPRRRHRSAVEIEWTIELGFCREPRIEA